MPEVSISSPTGDKYAANRRGPNTEPCGTAAWQVVADDEWEPSFTNCRLSDRFERSHAKAASRRPNSSCKLCINKHAVTGRVKCCKNIETYELCSVFGISHRVNIVCNQGSENPVFF
jgi:hypothetical protein